MLFRYTCLSVLLTVSQVPVANSNNSPITVNLSEASDSQKLSYILGIDMHEKRSRQGFILDPEMVAQAIRDEQTGMQPQISSAEYMRIVPLSAKKLLNSRLAGKHYPKKT